MGTGMIVCGCNGSGKSTLGRELALALGYTFIDIEDCFFPDRGAKDPYESPLSRADAQSILLERAKRSRHFVLACVKGDYGAELLPLYRWAVYISVPEEIRLWRLRERSLQKFGARALPGGDLYARENAFFKAAAARTEEEVQSWLGALHCPVIAVDGTAAPKENVRLILSKVQGRAPGM